MKKLLIIGATHGNERMGIEIEKELRKNGYARYYDFLIANPRALKRKARFVDCDLNRSYPGDKKSAMYEKKLAAKNLAVARKYKYIIDIHEASSGKNDFIITVEKNLNMFPVQYLNLDKCLLWPEPRGPLYDAVNNSVELEFGTMNRDRKDLTKKGYALVARFIESIVNKEKAQKFSQRIYSVYGILKVDELKNRDRKLIEFKEFNNQCERFLPLLVNQYLDQGILCYKMSRWKNNLVRKKYLVMKKKDKSLDDDVLISLV